MNRSQRRRVNKQNAGHKTEQTQRSETQSEFDNAKGPVDRLRITWKHVYKPGKRVTIYGFPLVLLAGVIYTLCRLVAKPLYPVYIMGRVWVQALFNHRL